MSGRNVWNAKGDRDRPLCCYPKQTVLVSSDLFNDICNLNCVNLGCPKKSATPQKTIEILAIHANGEERLSATRLEAVGDDKHQAPALLQVTPGVAGHRQCVVGPQMTAFSNSAVHSRSKQWNKYLTLVYCCIILDHPAPSPNGRLIDL